MNQSWAIYGLVTLSVVKTKKNSVALVCEQTIPAKLNGITFTKISQYEYSLMWNPTLLYSAEEWVIYEVCYIP
jgi:hypothetical protein